MNNFFYILAVGIDNIPINEEKAWSKAKELSSHYNLPIVILTDRPNPSIYSRIKQSKNCRKIKTKHKPSIEELQIVEKNIVFIDNLLEDSLKKYEKVIKKGVFISYTDENKLLSWKNIFNAIKIE